VTHVLVAVDRSASMSGLEEETRSGYNGFLDDLCAGEPAGGLVVTTVLFDHEVTRLCTAVPIGVAPRLDRDNYRVRGYTALYDAVGQLIVGFEEAVTLGEHDRVQLMVQTDGRENASKEFSAERVRALIGEREASGKWSTAYLGAGPAAWDGGAVMGMRSVNTVGDAGSTRSSYAGMAAATRSYAGGASANSSFETLRGIATGGSGGESA
jgi:hypothetical protein